MFFSLDGIDGVGKSTQIDRLVEWLRAAGHDVVTCRDPGSTPLGERLRELLLRHDDSVIIDPRAEMLMYMAARAQLVEQLIRPALAAGQIVVSDRFVLANIVYQAHAGGLDVDDVRAVGRVTTGAVVPDRVYLLDLPVDEADRRLGSDRDRMESRGSEYRQRLRAGFLAEAARDPASILVVDAAGSVDEVSAAIRADAERMLAG
jgi:dTMP kinase